MGKTHDDEVYKDGVREGQRGGFLEDLVEGNISHTSKDEIGMVNKAVITHMMAREVMIVKILLVN